ncbi:GNAT family protein [Jeotgalibacillus sp. ET6]|uniref:GNAT family N-acetyltransferase n=1 Tax=Jeotgalibacillus sp. ET6 TaxID=3037260 RepID=UPI00241895EE|nr:GNAT family protein [Jeotgalibacillus sp. ET6]MDG5471491.1 GNAT family protein [Jeotgalibacillus sp. ET6]
MNNLVFTRFENEVEHLVHFMTQSSWDFHSNPKPTREGILIDYNDGLYDNDNEIYWIELEQKKIGLIMIHDSSDTIPLFDIRLEEGARAKGIGALAVKWLTDHIFNQPNKIRIEAYTRSDNTAMRKTLNKCGFVKEGYLRQAWENEDGGICDSVCYAMIRSDWENKTRTPIKLNDLPY